jgi:cell division septation protein DedD
MFLRFKKAISYHLEEESSEDRWFRVYIGEFDNENNARKAGSELREKGIISYFKPIEINKDLLKK